MLWASLLNQLVGNRANSGKYKKIWKGASSSRKYKKNDQQLILWAGTSQNSLGTIPAHERVEKHQLTWKIVKYKIN